MVVAFHVLVLTPLWLVVHGQGADRPITGVVKLLQSLLKSAQSEGDAERDLYAKYKCYCDTNEATTKGEIEELNKEIGLLESKIEELLASTGSLSDEVTKLKQDMAANKAAQTEATNLRDTENREFMAKKGDLEFAIEQMKDAIDVLSDVGADQTQNTAADHTYYMAGHSSGFTELKTVVRRALVAASAFTSQRQAASVDAFLQAPFTGSYSAQSGEVVGILKDMRDTFKANRDAAMAAESEALKVYNKFMDHMKQAWEDMSDESREKQRTLAGNDGDLASKRLQLGTAQEDLSSAEVFLSTLLQECSAKKKQYNNRVDLRKKEEVALTEAIAILNSDSAFGTFGKAMQTNPSFLQYHAIRKHSGQGAGTKIDKKTPRQEAQMFLQGVAGTQHLPLLGRIVALLQGNNPFSVVLAEINKMINLIADEGKADTEQHSWCDDERRQTTASISQKENEIGVLEANLHELASQIADPDTGLQTQIANTESDLRDYHDIQVGETTTRKNDNLLYQENIKNLVEAEALISRAIVVLRQYYSKIDSEISAQFLQGQRQEQAPATWTDDYKGQSAGGHDVIQQLEFILDNTKTTESTAHTDELNSQHSFEDIMTLVKEAEAAAQTSLGNLKAELAQKMKEMMFTDKEISATTKEKNALEKYLLNIKPGCNFIKENIATREAYRKKESDALAQAVIMLKESSAYKEAQALAHDESLGQCLSICKRDEEHVDCKACLAKTSVPGYCAGHQDTVGC